MDNPFVQAAQALSEIGYDRDVALMEVERLRADNAALRAVIATILATGKNIGDCEVRLVPFDTMKQARALLAKGDTDGD